LRSFSALKRPIDDNNLNPGAGGGSATTLLGLVLALCAAAILPFMALSFVFDSESVRWQWLLRDG